MEVFIESSSASAFTVKLNLQGWTNLFILNIAYIAVDYNFGYEVAMFSNVPVNDTAGNLANITSSSTTLQTYTNSINYQLQAGGRSYNTFS